MKLKENQNNHAEKAQHTTYNTYNIENCEYVLIVATAPPTPGENNPPPLQPHAPQPQPPKSRTPWLTVWQNALFLGNLALKLYEWWSKLGS